MDLGVQVEPQFGFSYEAVRDIARGAHAAGFTRLWVSDHLFLNKDSVAQDCLEAWTLLAALARDTEGIRIGPMVSAQSYRNPALLAKIAAGVDHMSGGRLEFGLGAGWKEVEYKAYGYEFPEPGVRVTQLVETLEICTRLWKDDRATYRGKYYRVEDAVASPKPLQKRLPIWIGGTKPRVMRIAAKWADWFNMSNPGTDETERIPMLRDGIHAACKAVGRDPSTLRTSIFVLGFVAPTRAELDELIRELAARAKTTPEQWRQSRAGAIVGTTDEAGERFRAIAKTGIDHANVMLPYGRELAGIKALAQVARERQAVDAR
ncbi:MAG: TIGR03560 family F420-dependent LLM class oxidoreductase [Chloroflexi bacterium]|nr:MAG: TIGR03560 family F420-dependent LLM class oxidoreductase [Chloroflexota bacterium]TMC25867.1 MAG: TIGR03560 family F420-dependent LLM class oxidoreductase [Chloroflexota bacterium]TMC33404.1 MAG: TIGR03560 family F420-dependent LLM class oxidoreductase [Chloroflexota bacterium]